MTFERYCSFSYGGCPVSKRKSDWISARIYYFPHHMTEYPDSTRVPENFWIFTRRILFGLDIYPRGSRVRPGLPTPKSAHTIFGKWFGVDGAVNKEARLRNLY